MVMKIYQSIKWPDSFFFGNNLTGKNSKIRQIGLLLQQNKNH